MIFNHTRIKKIGFKNLLIRIIWSGLVECIPNIKESLSEIKTLQEEISGYRPEIYAQLVDVEKEQTKALEEINQKIGECTDQA